MPIKDCKDRNTRPFLAGEQVKAFDNIADAANEALTKLQAAIKLIDLRMPPSNHFKAVQGVYSIRVNRQYRVCFKWAPHGSAPEDADILQVEGDPCDVEINKHYGD
jgi:toxin HigB-1